MSYSGRHLGFHTLKMIRKNDTLIFLKVYDVFFQNQVSFCFYQKKNTKLQMSLHYISLCNFIKVYFIKLRKEWAIRVAVKAFTEIALAMS